MQDETISFHCVECGKDKTHRHKNGGGGLGFAERYETGDKVCYECCGKLDRARMIENRDLKGFAALPRLATQPARNLAQLVCYQLVRVSRLSGFLILRRKTQHRRDHERTYGLTDRTGAYGMASNTAAQP